MTFTLTPINVKNAAGSTTAMVAYNDGTNNAFAHAAVDATGAIVSPATSGNQTTANSSLATIATNTTGVATSALQSTGNSSLASIATNTAGGATAANQSAGNTSLGNLDANLGAKADAAAGSDTGTFSLLSLVKRSLQTLASILTACQAATPAGTNLIGAVAQAGNGVHLTSAPAVTAGAYTTGQVVGGLISLSGAARVNAGSGLVQSVLVNVKTALTAPYDVIFFDTNPATSTFTDNAALAVNVADLPFVCGVAHCTDLVSGGTPQILQATNVGLPFKLSAAATTLYAVIVLRGAQTFASTSAVGLSAVVVQD